MSCKKCLNKYNKINRQPFILIPCGHTFCSQCINDFQSCYNCLSDINNKILNQDLFDLLNQDLYNLLSQREAATRKLNELELKNKLVKLNVNLKSDMIQEKLKETEKEIIRKTNEKVDIIYNDQNDLILSIRKESSTFLEHLNKLESNEKKIEIKLNIIKNNLNNSESVEINRILESAEHEIENNLKHLDNIDFESHLKSNDWLSKNGIIIGPADASFTSSNALEITHVILNH
jgi:predicted nuclease with TOPRIM domain